jgi:spermidine synthase
VLLPALGSAGAVRLAGACLVLAGFAVLGSARPGRAWVVLLLPVVTAFLPHPPAPPDLLERVETRYQAARVELDPDGTRLLRLNEGLDSFHSAFRPGDLWSGRYFDAFALPAVSAPPGPDGVRRVLVLGLAAGTMAREAALLDPGLQVQGVELDATLVDLGRRWFDLPDSVRVAIGDARVALASSRTPWGAILVDCYSEQIYLPPHLCTREFFELVRARLVPGGVAALNLGGRTREDPVVSAVAYTFGSVFQQAAMARIPGTRNWIVLGWNGPAPDGAALATRLDQLGARARLEWMLTGGLFAPVPRTGRLLVDRDAPVEALAHEAWRRGA